jgi:internalin A
MRTIVLIGLLLAILSVNLIAAPLPRNLKPIPEPTAEQLIAAKEAYAKHGAKYDTSILCMKDGDHVFLMPFETTDADLKGLPNLPFRFGLSLYCTQVTDAGLKELKELKNLTALHVNTNVTDTGRKELKEFKNLAHLSLYAATNVTDAGMKEIKNLKSLTALDLTATKITDAGMNEIKELRNLADLSLTRTHLSDAGLKELKELKKLTSLLLIGTKVTDAGVKELREALPNCKIVK